MAQIASPNWSTAGDSSQARPRILLVDDDRPVADALAEILCDDGYDVVKAYGAREALRESDTGPFDLLLLDVWMPEMNGVELLRVLRGRRHTAAAPAALITAFVNIPEEDLAREGIRACFQKPFDVGEFLFRIQGLCGPEVTALAVKKP